MVELYQIEIHRAIGKHLFNDSIFFVIPSNQSSMLQQRFRFGLNRKTSVIKSFVLLTPTDAKERHLL
jgi:hypothetical protein